VNNVILGTKGNIVVMITPLISLMIDQKEEFKRIGISTEFVEEAQEDGSTEAAVISGNVELVFISPESLLGNPCFHNMLLSEHFQQSETESSSCREAHSVKLYGKYIFNY